MANKGEGWDHLDSREAARARARDRKQRGPKVVVDNISLKKLTIQQAEKTRRQASDRGL